jgi:two-component system nitrate/nitrite response regulator NarL
MKITSNTPPVSFRDQDRTTYVIDSNRLSREGLMRLLIDTKFEILGHASNFDDLINDPGIEPPAFVLIVMSGDADAMKSKIGDLRAMAPMTKIVLMADGVEPPPLAEFFGAGVDGYLLKDISTQAFLGSLNLIQAGERVFPSQLIPLILQGMRDNQPRNRLSAVGEAYLSSRETQVLSSLVDGSPNKIIANRLNLTEATVKVHVKSILRKIKADNRTQAAIWALQNGFGHTGPAPSTPQHM